jgi:PKD repeat protein
MKVVCTLFLTVILFLSSCKKADNSTLESKEAYTSAAAPTAAFRIANTHNSDGVTILENKILCLENTSENADTYYWEFGTVKTSTDKFPTQISLSPCSGYVTVKLTTKNREGKTATATKDYYVLCSNGVTGGKTSANDTMK